MLGLVDYGEEEEEEEGEGVAMEQSSSTRRPLIPDPPTTPPAHGGHVSKRPRLKKKGVRWAGPDLLEDVFLFFKDQPIDPDAMVEDGEEEETVVDSNGGLSLGPSMATNVNAGSMASNGGLSSSTGASSTGLGPSSPPSSFSSSIYTPRETVVTVVRRKKGTATGQGGGGGGGAQGGGVTVIHPTHHVQDLIPHGRERLQQVGLGGSNEWGSGKGSSGERLTGRGGVALHDAAAFEFFCDQCHYTIDKNQIRYECAECPGEFCLCGDCYDEQNEGEEQEGASYANNGGGNKRTGRRRHPHELRLSRLPYHASLLQADMAADA